MFIIFGTGQQQSYNGSDEMPQVGGMDNPAFEQTGDTKNDDNPSSKV